MKYNPLISIIINNYNYGCFINEAIDSVLNQTYNPIEIIVVDDGSTDNSQEIIASYGDKIIPILKENGGQASALNAGVTACKGKFIFFLDSDDIFKENKVKEILDVFIMKMTNTPSVMVYHPLEAIDENGSSLGYRICDTIFNCPPNLYEHACQYKYFIWFASTTSGIAITRELAIRIFPIPEKGVLSSADEFIVRAAYLLGEGYGVDLSLSKYRIHGKNIWYFNQGAKTKEFMLILEKFLNTKLEQNNMSPVISYFNSIYALDYYVTQGSSEELFKLALKFPSWGINLKTIKFFLKTTFLAINLKFKEMF